MSATSFITDYYFKKYPQPWNWNTRLYNEYLELISLAKEYDALATKPMVTSENRSMEASVSIYLKNKTLS